MQANGERKGAFTLIMLDLDDTLIPTSIRQILFKNFDIDIFKLFKQTLLKRLQLNIIRSLNNIKQKLAQSTDDHIEIALISNATLNWLKKMLLVVPPQNDRSSTKKEEVYFKILHKYFVRNNISIHSAKAENKTPRGPEGDKQNVWILKYKSIAALVKRKETELQMKCRQIVSFGDGFNEKEALKVYSSATKVRCLHFELITAPTVYQLNKQWDIIANEVDIVSLMKMDYFLWKTDYKHAHYLIYAMKEKMPWKNNKECVCKRQLSAISTYFGLWIENVNKNKSKYRSKKTVMNVAEKVHLRQCVMKRSNKYNDTSYQKIVDVFCSHQEFRNALQNIVR